MKKFFLAVLVAIFSVGIITGCSATIEPGGYDRRIIEKANAELEENPALYTADYKVSYSGRNVYTVVINGEENKVEIPEQVDKENIGTNVSEVTEASEGECFEIFEKAKKEGN